jgi:hypothetical protein
MIPPLRPEGKPLHVGHRLVEPAMARKRRSLRKLIEPMATIAAAGTPLVVAVAVGVLQTDRTRRDSDAEDHEAEKCQGGGPYFGGCRPADDSQSSR